MEESEEKINVDIELEGLNKNTYLFNNDATVT